MIQALCTCKSRIFIDGETGHKFADSAASTPHKCQTNPVPLYEMFNGILCNRREDYIAKDVIAEAVKVGLNPYKVRTARRGDYLIILG